MCFYVQLLSLSMVFVRFVHLVPFIRGYSFSLVSSTPWEILPVYSLHYPDGGHLDCLQFLVIINKAAMKTLVQDFIWM